MMRKRAFVPSMDGTILEERAVPSTIPYVIAPPGVPQGWINFTTHRASQALHGDPVRNRDGIYRAFDNFNHNGDIFRLENTLFQISTSIPYGVQRLLPSWRADLAGLSFHVRDTNGVAQNEVLTDFVNYLKANEGVTLNYLLSQGGHNELGGVPVNGHV
jgi:hypothetical protein